MPDTFFRNEKEARKHEIIVPNVYVRIFPDGEILYSIRYVLGPEYVQNVFFSSLKKHPTRENWDKLSVYFSIFEWWSWSKHQFCQIAKCQLVCLSFLWWEVLLREREKTFCTYSGYWFKSYATMRQCHFEVYKGFKSYDTGGPHLIQFFGPGKNCTKRESW